ncbi:MAG TPA: hypothetical protein VFC26_07275 [Verrucomicrobiae bacterium]|nr:hypothetical protein [Verrucomicrobiae bacterium]
MKRIVLRSVLVLALLFIFVAGTLTLMRGFSASRLEKWKDEMGAKGEKLRVAELVPGPVVSNALLPRLIQARNELGRSAPSTPLMRIVSQGVAHAAGKRTNASPSMHRLVDDKAATLTEIRDAVKLRPRDLGWDYTNWNAYPGSALVDIRDSAHWLAAAMVIELDRSRRAAALTNLLALLDLAHCHEREGTLVSQMVRVALAGMAFSASWEALQFAGWTDAELTELQHSWEQLALAGPLEFGLQMERAVALTYFEMGRHGDTNAIGMIASMGSFAEGFYAPLWQMALSKGDELHYLRTIQTFLEALRATQEKRSGLELQRRAGQSDGWLAAYRYPMSNALRPNIGKALKRWLRMETERQLVLAAIGVERFRLRDGHYPEKLSQLVPEILPALPVDFGDGQPIRYQREGDGFRLWSVTEGAQWPRAESLDGK